MVVVVINVAMLVVTRCHAPPPQVITCTARALESVGRNSLALLRNSVAQIAANPDVTALTHMLRAHELFPESMARPEAYKYAGDGSGSGGPADVDGYEEFDPFDKGVYLPSIHVLKSGTTPNPLTPTTPHAGDDASSVVSGGVADDVGFVTRLAGNAAASGVGPKGSDSRKASRAARDEYGTPQAVEEKWEADFKESWEHENREWLKRRNRRREEYRQKLEAVKVVTRLPADTLLMHWVNHHLKAFAGPDAASKRIRNFDADIRDGEVLAQVMAQIAWEPACYKALSARDPGRRCELVAEHMASVLPSADAFITSEHIASGDAHIVSAVLGRLYTTHSALEPAAAHVRPTTAGWWL